MGRIADRISTAVCCEPFPHRSPALELVFDVGSAWPSDGVARVACLQVRVVSGSGETVAYGRGHGGSPRPKLEPGRDVSGWQLLDGLSHQGPRADVLEPHRIGDRLLDRCIPADDIPPWERQVRPGWLLARPIVAKGRWQIVWYCSLPGRSRRGSLIACSVALRSQIIMPAWNSSVINCHGHIGTRSGHCSPDLVLSVKQER